MAAEVDSRVEHADIADFDADIVALKARQLLRV